MSIQRLAENGNEVLRAKYCPVGYGMIQLKDEFSCCAVCGRQNGELCDALAPCDSTLELVCKYENVKTPKQGICRRKYLNMRMNSFFKSIKNTTSVLTQSNNEGPNVEAQQTIINYCRLISFLTSRNRIFTIHSTTSLIKKHQSHTSRHTHTGGAYINDKFDFFDSKV